MGWCSGTQVFDEIVGALLGESEFTKEQIISRLIDTLEDMDWDCQSDSEFYGHPMVQPLFKQKHPEWFDDE